MAQKRTLLGCRKFDDDVSVGDIGLPLKIVAEKSAM